MAKSHDILSQVVMGRKTATKSTTNVKDFVEAIFWEQVEQNGPQWGLTVDTALFAWCTLAEASEQGHSLNHQSVERRLRAESAILRAKIRLGEIS